VSSTQDIKRREGVIAPGQRVGVNLVKDELTNTRMYNGDKQLSLPMKNNIILAESLSVLHAFNQAVESEFGGIRGQAESRTR
jgi:hypothetical protein